MSKPQIVRRAPLKTNSQPKLFDPDKASTLARPPRSGKGIQSEDIPVVAAKLKAIPATNMHIPRAASNKLAALLSQFLLLDKEVIFSYEVCSHFSVLAGAYP